MLQLEHAGSRRGLLRLGSEVSLGFVRQLSLGLASPSVRLSGTTASLRVSLNMSDNSKKADNKLAGVSPQERRIFPRYPFSAAAEAVYADARLRGRTSDLSRGGCYVDTINPFPMGAEIRIRISKGNQTF